MKLALAALCSWLAALACIVASLYAAGETPSRADIFGFGTASLALTVLMIALFYLPGLWLLKRRLAGVKPAAVFPLAAGLALNAPAFLALAYVAGRTMVAEEARTFALAALLAGLTFGLGFVWSESAKLARTRA
ncbi:MAG: hypothetical protein LC746_16725 [Acidobacteria bacterium]|nr:hypothetical protein [Acidobacteriota bacterium]